MNVPNNLQYSKSHEWVDFLEDGSARIGLTDFAQDSLGEIVFLTLPEVGDPVTKGESLGDVESVKAVSEVLSPVSGTVSAVNEDVLDAPEAVNADPYEAWLVTVTDVGEKEALLDAAAYDAFCQEEG